MGIVLAVPLWAGFAAGQSKSSCDQMKAGAPQKVEGRSCGSIRPQGKVAVTEADGKTHELIQASKEDAPGSEGRRQHRGARLRELPKC